MPNKAAHWLTLLACRLFSDVYTVRNDLAVEPINNRYVRITLPESLRKNIPLKDLFKSLPKAFDDGIAQMDKTQFAMLPLDERAKRLGATYRISHKQNSEQGEIYSTALFNSIVQQLEDNQKMARLKAMFPRKSCQIHWNAENH